MSDDVEPGYVHGYSDREAARLADQAGSLAELLHAGTRYAPGSAVLEAGCGVGAQTVILARNSPGARFTDSLMTCAARSSGRTAARPEPNLPTGVRTASYTKA